MDVRNIEAVKTRLNEIENEISALAADVFNSDGKPAERLEGRLEKLSYELEKIQEAVEGAGSKESRTLVRATQRMLRKCEILEERLGALEEEYEKERDGDDDCDDDEDDDHDEDDDDCDDDDDEDDDHGRHGKKGGGVYINLRMEPFEKDFAGLDAIRGSVVREAAKIKDTAERIESEIRRGMNESFEFDGEGGYSYDVFTDEERADKNKNAHADGKNDAGADGSGMISKKEILKMFSISYGQLYRWKREGLIPDEWFIKQSVSTGQETFFKRAEIIPRIRQIVDLKDSCSLDAIKERIKKQPAQSEDVDIRAAMLIDGIDPHFLRDYAKAHEILTRTECAVIYLLSLNKDVLGLNSLEDADFSDVKPEHDLFIVSLGGKQGYVIGGLVFDKRITVQRKINVGEAFSVISKACGVNENE